MHVLKPAGPFAREANMKFLLCVLAFHLALLSSGILLNLYHMNERMRMQVFADEYHQALLRGNREAMDMALTDDFTETGYSIAVSSPLVTTKSDLMNSKLFPMPDNYRTELRYVCLSNLFPASDNSITFARTYINDDSPPDPFNPFAMIVTYTFEKDADKLRIKHIERHWVVPPFLIW